MGKLFSKGSASIHSFANVQLDVKRSVYLAGEVIEGYIVANVLQETHVHHFKVVLSGELSDCINHTAVHPIGRVSQECYRAPNGTVAAGNFRIPFRLVIPEEWDPSIECMDERLGLSRGVATRFYVQVFARSQSWFSQDYKLCSKEIKLASEPVLPTVSTLSKVFDMNRSGFLGAFKVSGEVVCIAELLQTAYTPGSHCRLRLFLENQSTLAVRFNKVKLLQKLYLSRSGFLRSLVKEWPLPVTCVVEAENPESTSAKLKEASAPPVEGPSKSSQSSDTTSGVNSMQVGSKTKFGCAKANTQMTIDVVLPLDTELQSVDFHYKQSLFIRVVYLLEVKLSPASMVSSPIRMEVPITLTLSTTQDQPMLAHAVPEARVVEPGEVTADTHIVQS